ncbi:transposase [Lentimicrobium sp. S6]|uniref:transposase n=1 Tax=Lentimicrobium sp. S6 TaxID=2735872 RepID=UPI001C132A3C|nr:transposase [Lentimicrobium sp. S6]
MIRPLRPLKKLPALLNDIRISLNKDRSDSVNLYFQDESKFGLMIHVGRCFTAKGIKPIIKYQHAFKNTYLYGRFSSIGGGYFIYEIEGTTSEIFYNYLLEFSKYKSKELKIIIIDNAGFHSLKQYDTPDNIKLIRIPPYTPELNPSEKMWAYIKQFYKNKVFNNLDNTKKWLYDFVKNNINNINVKSIMHTDLYNDAFVGCLIFNWYKVKDETLLNQTGL